MSKKNETSDTNIMTEYLDLTQQYVTKYGTKTVVLLQVGAFFEVYGLKHHETGDIAGSQIEDFSQVCQLNVSEKKITYQGKQVVMAGFRDYTLEKYLQKLTDQCYTAVVYVQEKEGKQVKRVFYGVYSAGTYLSYETETSPQITNHIMCIWFERFSPLDKNQMKDTIVYGASAVNIFTGSSTMFEHETAFIMNPTTFDELERYVSTYCPSEVIVVSSLENNIVQRILQYIGVQTNCIHKVVLHEHPVAQNCTKQNYQRHILSTFFGEEIYSICSEFENHPLATQSFCYLTNFIQEHNPNLVRNISIPHCNNHTDRMILANHTLKQLNIIQDNANDKTRNGQLSCVLSFLNKCNTAMGRRLFQYQLLNPTTCQDWLSMEYTMTEIMLSQDWIDGFRKQLLQVRDIEKITRQLMVKRLYPSSIFHLYKSIEGIQEMNTTIKDRSDVCDYLCSGLDIKSNTSFDYINTICNDVLHYLNQTLYIDACKQVNNVSTFDVTIIRPGVCKELDDIVIQYEEKLSVFHHTKTALNNLINNETDHIKVHETEKSGMSLVITKTRATALKKIIKQLLQNDEDKAIYVPDTSFVFFLKDIKFVTATSSNDEIDISELNKISKQILVLKEKMNDWIGKTYSMVLEQLENGWFHALEHLAKYVSKLDVLQCKAYIARTYHYCKPEIVTTETNTSMVRVVELRHCLIEHLQKNELYVTNNIQLGEEIKGVLLYGTNAVGKTSFIRALGIAIIMAQAGLYVPCTRFEYVPYHSIYSRILGNDNLFKGLSTFAVEMSELRIILKMANEHSLILGDELCSGTETESALSIFVAGLMNLHEKKSTFIFATHFHEIVRYDEIKELSNVALMHMSVSYDRERDCLVYDRILKSGSGSRTYGLEVCKSLYLPEEFLENAYSIRNKYFPVSVGELSKSTSRYNVEKIKGICEMCNETVGSEIHHLQHQADADKEGFIGTFHKNHMANLLTVCERCHTKFHAQSTTTNIPKQKKKTTKGYALV
jgi:DNA mismatch repair protein MutS